MLERPHENPEYQYYLISDQREKFIPQNIYLNIFQKETRHNLNILDFGTGFGYVSILLSQLKLPGLKIYACDYQEEMLDMVWKRATMRELSNISAFHLEDKSEIYFPGFLPAIDYVICSFSLSCVADARAAMQSFQGILNTSASIHIIDWDMKLKNPKINEFFPEENRLTHNIIAQWLEMSGYQNPVSEFGKSDYFYVKADWLGNDNRNRFAYARRLQY